MGRLFLLSILLLQYRMVWWIHSNINLKSSMRDWSTLNPNPNPPPLSLSLQLVTLKPTVSPPELTKLYRALCQTVLDSGGTIRCIEHHGIRQLPYRFRSRQGRDDERYFTHGRWISMYADMKPKTLHRIEHQLRLHEGYLRSNFLVPNVKMRWVNVFHFAGRSAVCALFFVCFLLL